MRYAVLCLSVFLLACASPSGSVPVSTQGAQTLTGAQGMAQETGSATTHANPVIYHFNLFGTSTVRIGVAEDGTETVEATTEGGAVIEGATFHAPTVNYEGAEISSETSSGGGGSAGQQNEGGNDGE